MIRVFSEQFIEDLRCQVDIVDVVSEHVPLKRAGKNLVGLCPFHPEKTPSFTVSPEKQMFYCFGCGAGGNAFSFLMRRENLTFPEAVQLLAERYGIATPARRPGRAALVYRALELAQAYFRANLAGSPAGEYIATRGIDKATAERFGLGYAPPGWDGMRNALSGRRVPPEVLEKAGLVVPRPKRGGCYDRFRNRLMFPIWDRRGRVVAFGGRSLDGSEPKYLNSPETEIFSKGKVLYGLHLAKDAIHREGFAIIVEGYMDVLTAHQFGFQNVVGSMGTSLSREQAEMLVREAGRVVIAYDADASGHKATLRGLEVLREAGGEVMVATLPEGLDPDALIRTRGRDAFEALLRNAVPYVEYKLSLALSGVDLDSVQGRLRALKRVFPVLASLKDAVEQGLYLRMLAARLRVPEDALRIELGKLVKSSTRGRAPGHRSPGNRYNNDMKLLANYGEVGSAQRRCIIAERNLIKLMMEYPPARKAVESRLLPEDFTDGRHRAILQRIMEVEAAGQEPTPAAVALHLGDDEAQVISGLALDDSHISPPDKVVDDCIKVILEHKMERRLQELQNRLNSLEKSGQVIDEALLREYHALVQQRSARA